MTAPSPGRPPDGPFARYRAEAARHGVRRADFRTISGLPLDPFSNS